MRLDKLTIKTREALVAAQELAARTGQPEMQPEHVLPALAPAGGRPGRPAAQEGRRRPAAHRRRADAGDRSPAQAAGRHRGRHLAQDARSDRGAPSAKPRSSRTSTSRPSTSCWRCVHKDFGAAVARAQGRRASTTTRCCKALAEVRGTQRVTDENPEGKYQALEQVHARSHRAGAQGQARSGHRPRRGDPPRHPGAVAPHQEQPGADRRARRRQDRHRRGHRAAHRRRRRARVAEGQAHPGARSRRAGRRHQVPRRVRGSPRRRCSRRSRRRPGSVILFIDELHTLVGAGAAEGAMDAANMLKPALARGELRCIGATTLDEYRKHIEKDKALERRFQPVFVGEPSRGGHDRDPARPQGEVRGAPRHPHPRRARWSRRRGCRTATSPTASCPTRRSIWSTRRPAALKMEIDSLPDADRQICSAS